MVQFCRGARHYGVNLLGGSVVVVLITSLWWLRHPGQKWHCVWSCRSKRWWFYVRLGSLGIEVCL